MQNLLDNMLLVALLYYLIINLLSFLLFGIDKYFSIKKHWRISERALITTFLLGGIIGGYLGMKIFHHKTRKLKFKIFLALSLILHIYFIFYINKFEMLP